MSAKTEEGKARQKAALMDHRVDAPNLKHGVPGFLQSGLHPCDKCVKRTKCKGFKKGADCIYLAKYQEDIENQVMDLDYVEEQDRMLVQVLAKDMAAIALCEMYFSVEGLVIHDRRKKQLSAQPLVSTYNELKRQVRQSMQALGIGPAARAKLKMEQVNVVKQISELGLDDGKDNDGDLSFLRDDEQ
ncbi:P27 family phage terminase small subunit [Brevibacillus sp. HD3.3A]|uniref:P27 family phage terminase small subunit n=1 Tax=Brevibacillus sp. HD3.3A TaxID=2738979 RepID=UPI00156B7990|nr:P27 family phage terminase small subunit [Brevibacillus sp. HD3.3A]UED70684.1 P27 family phage terminase small subunit [Brevibacillus sp. HD3.3A]